MIRLLLVFSFLTATCAAAGEVTLTIYPDRVLNRIDEKIYGHFLEHIYHSCNGGLWGELVWDRSFEGGGGGVVWTQRDGCIVQEGRADNVRLLFGDPRWTDYEFTVEARKTGGNEGFLVLLRALNNREFYWANLGGWGNIGHALERGSGVKTAGTRSPAVMTAGSRPAAGIASGPAVKGRAFSVGSTINWSSTTPTTAGGRVRGRAGVGTWQTQAQFRNFKVTSLDGKTFYKGLPPLPKQETGVAPTLASVRRRESHRRD